MIHHMSVQCSPFFFLKELFRPPFGLTQDNDGVRTSPTPGRPATLATPSMASTPTSKCTQCLIFFCRKNDLSMGHLCAMGVGSNS